MENSMPATTETKTPEVVTPAPFNPIAILSDKGTFDQIWRAATLFAKSDIVPAAYKGKPENCFIAMELASRMNVPAFAIMQNVAIVNGKPGMEAKLIIAMINNSGLFVDPIEYEIVGADPSYDKKKNAPVDPTYKVRAFATRKKTGKTLYGEWITWDMAIAEGWVSKSGSKWQSMPGQMFCYRAASFFGKLYCPDLTFGMQTVEELQDITPYPTTAEGPTTRAASIVSRFTEEAETAQTVETGEIPLSAEEAAEAAQTESEANPLLQDCYQLLADLSALRAESPDDIIDTLTNHKIGCQQDLADRPVAYLNDIKLMLEAEKAKEA